MLKDLSRKHLVENPVSERKAMVEVGYHIDHLYIEILVDEPRLRVDVHIDVVLPVVCARSEVELKRQNPPNIILQKNVKVISLNVCPFQKLYTLEFYKYLKR